MAVSPLVTESSTIHSPRHGGGGHGGGDVALGARVGRGVDDPALYVARGGDAAGPGRPGVGPVVDRPLRVARLAQKQHPAVTAAAGHGVGADRGRRPRRRQRAENVAWRRHFLRATRAGDGGRLACLRDTLGKSRGRERSDACCDLEGSSAWEQSTLPTGFKHRARRAQHVGVLCALAHARTCLLLFGRDMSSRRMSANRANERRSGAFRRITMCTCSWAMGQ